MVQWTRLSNQMAFGKVAYLVERRGCGSLHPAEVQQQCRPAGPEYSKSHCSSNQLGYSVKSERKRSRGPGRQQDCLSCRTKRGVAAHPAEVQPQCRPAGPEYSMHCSSNQLGYSVKSERKRSRGPGRQQDCLSCRTKRGVAAHPAEVQAQSIPRAIAAVTS